LGLVFKKSLKLPYCIIYYGGEFPKFKNNKILISILEAVIKNSDGVIAISDFARQELKNFGLGEGKIFKLTPGVDTDRFKIEAGCFELKQNLQLCDKKVLLTAARLVRRKGIDLVIKAIAILREDFPDIVYLVIGRGKEEDNLRGLTSELGLKNKVIFVGEVTEEELPKYYNLCDIYVMPNIETRDEDNIEGFGISFIEASACGKPVIAGLTGGAGEAVIDGRTGILIDPRDTHRLAGAIARLLKNRDYAQGLGKNGRKMAEEEFQWKPRAEFLITIFNQILRSK
jgi:phosphatidylinositol alpha-1,6-mannosyltransferase